MKNIRNNPVEKFKYLVKGSAMARNLSFIYVLVSIVLIYKMWGQLEYIIPLIFGVVLIVWYTLTHLMLRGIDLKTNNDIKHQFRIYKGQTLKREKYEFTVYFVWLVTIVPAFLNGNDISTFTVIKWMIAIYIIVVIGGKMFKKVKDNLNELEQQLLE